MSNWQKDYIEQHAIGSSKYGWTGAKSLYNDVELFVRIFDAPPPKEGAEWGENELRQYYFRGAQIWVEFGRTSRGELTEWCGVHCDYAVPQSWFDKFEETHGYPPRAVWAYRWHDSHGQEVVSTFGAPMFIDDMLLKLVEAAYRQALAERQEARRDA